MCLRKGRNRCSTRKVTALERPRSRSHSMTNRRTARTSRSWRCSEQSDKRRAIKFDSVTVQLPKNHVNRNRPPRVYIQPRFASFESNEPSSRKPREIFRKRQAPANPLVFPPHPIGRAVDFQWKRSAQLAQLHQHRRATAVISKSARVSSPRSHEMSFGFEIYKILFLLLFRH